MKKLLAVILLILLALPGCGPMVKKTVSGKFRLYAPHTVAILPLKFTDAENGSRPGAGVDALFNKMISNKLSLMNYKPLGVAEVDRRLAAAGDAAHGPREMAGLMGTDAVLHTTITEWKSDIVVRYAYLKVNALFELYSPDGTLLWQATHDIKESDIRLEKESLELAVIKAYEPSVQRFINVVFSTLPPSEPQPEVKSFFKWLP